MGPNGTDTPDLNRTSVVHPVWCSLPLCTAQFTPTIDEYRGAAPGTNYGRHLSKPLPLDISGWVRGFTRPVEVTLSLSQAVAPWTTTVYLGLTAGTANLSVPVAEAREVLASIGHLVGRAVPVYQEDDHWPAEVAKRHGSPASADDDNCPRCETHLWVTWLGEDDEQQNVWVHECGLQWRTRVRRPGNGVWYVLVQAADADDWEIRCLACGVEKYHFPNETTAQVAADAHHCEQEAAR